MNETLSNNSEQASVQEHPLQALAIKYEKARKESRNAQKYRVSRRLLLSIRAEKLTVCCPVTGIVSLLEVPAIPGFAAIYEHPLSSLANCRGLAQRGINYLRKLDTQVLAGILIVLADNYSLFRYQFTDSGAQKNAVLRMTGRDQIIDAILIIEDQIHSGNARFLPRLSLVHDTVLTDNVTLEVRMHNYLGELTAAIRKPDTERYDDNAKPRKIGRPVYIRDVEKNEKHLSYLARQEIAAAKKELAVDAKEAKILASNIVAMHLLGVGLKAFMSQLMSDNGMGLVEADPALVDMLIAQKLDPIQQQSEDAVKLIKILRKDRTILRMETSEDNFLDDPTPGNESAIEETFETTIEAQAQQQAEEYFAGYENENMHGSIGQPEEEQEPTPPAGLSTIEKILWLKRWRAAFKGEHKVNYQQSEIPSAHTYIPAHKLKKGE